MFGWLCYYSYCYHMWTILLIIILSTMILFNIRLGQSCSANSKLWRDQRRQRNSERWKNTGKRYLKQCSENTYLNFTVTVASSLRCTCWVSCFHRLRLDNCFDECNSHDSLLSCLMHYKRSYGVNGLSSSNWEFLKTCGFLCNYTWRLTVLCSTWMSSMHL